MTAIHVLYNSLYAYCTHNLWVIEPRKIWDISPWEINTHSEPKTGTTQPHVLQVPYIIRNRARCKSHYLIHVMDIVLSHHDKFVFFSLWN